MDDGLRGRGLEGRSRAEKEKSADILVEKWFAAAADRSLAARVS